MDKLNRVIDAVVFYLAALALGALSIICIAQVIARYAFHSAFVWAEEASIVILLWVTWIAACLAVKQRAHLRVTIVEDRLKPKTKIVIQLGLSFAAVVFLSVVALTGRLVMDSMLNMTLLSIPGIPMSIMYASVPAGSILMIFYLIRRIAADWKSLGDLSPKGR